MTTRPCCAGPFIALSCELDRYSALRWLEAVAAAWACPEGVQPGCLYQSRCLRRFFTQRYVMSDRHQIASLPVGSGAPPERLTMLRTTMEYGCCAVKAISFYTALDSTTRGLSSAALLIGACLQMCGHTSVSILRAPATALLATALLTLSCFLASRLRRHYRCRMYTGTSVQLLSAQHPSYSWRSGASLWCLQTSSSACVVAATAEPCAIGAAETAHLKAAHAQPVWQQPTLAHSFLQAQLLSQRSGRCGSSSDASSSAHPMPCYMPATAVQYVRLSLKVPGKHSSDAVLRLSTACWSQLIAIELAARGVLILHGYARLGCVQLVLDLLVPSEEAAATGCGSAAVSGGSRRHSADSGDDKTALSALLGPGMTPSHVVDLLCEGLQPPSPPLSPPQPPLQPILVQLHSAAGAGGVAAAAPGSWAWSVDVPGWQGTAAVLVRGSPAPAAPTVLHVSPPCIPIRASCGDTCLLQLLVAAPSSALQLCKVNARLSGQFLDAAITAVVDDSDDEVDAVDRDQGAPRRALARTTIMVTLTAPPQGGLLLLELELASGLMGPCRPLLVAPSVAMACELVQLASALKEHQAMLDNLLFDMGRWIEVAEHPTALSVRPAASTAWPPDSEAAARGAGSTNSQEAVPVAAEPAELLTLGGTFPTADGVASGPWLRSTTPACAAARLFDFFCARGMQACALHILRSMPQHRLVLSDVLGMVPHCEGLSLLHRLVRARQLDIIEAACAAGHSWDWCCSGPAGLTPLHLSVVLNNAAPVLSRLLRLAPPAAWYAARCSVGFTPAEFAEQAALGHLLVQHAQHMPAPAAMLTAKGPARVASVVDVGAAVLEPGLCGHSAVADADMDAAVAAVPAVAAAAAQEQASTSGVTVARGPDAEHECLLTPQQSAMDAAPAVVQRHSISGHAAVSAGTEEGAGAASSTRTPSVPVRHWTSLSLRHSAGAMAVHLQMSGPPHGARAQMEQLRARTHPPPPPPVTLPPLLPFPPPPTRPKCKCVVINTLSKVSQVRICDYDIVAIVMPPVALLWVAVNCSRAARAAGLSMLPEAQLPLLLCAARLVPLVALLLMPPDSWRRWRSTLLVGCNTAVSYLLAACGTGMLPLPAAWHGLLGLSFQLARVALCKPVGLQVSWTVSLYMYGVSMVGDTLLLRGHLYSGRLLPALARCLLVHTLALLCVWLMSIGVRRGGVAPGQGP